MSLFHFSTVRFVLPLTALGLCAACSAGGGSGDTDDESMMSGDGDGDGDGDGVLGSGGNSNTGGGANGSGGGSNLGTGGGSLGTGGTASTCTENAAGTTVAQGDGTFLDERTCLQWFTTPLKGGTAGDITGIEHVGMCSAQAVGGYNDWRGPDAGELETLITACTWKDTGNWVPEVDVTGLTFPDFWTITDGNDDTHTCLVRGQNGELNGGRRADTNVHVLCVRGTSSITGTVTTCGGTACD